MSAPPPPAPASALAVAALDGSTSFDPGPLDENGWAALLVATAPPADDLTDPGAVAAWEVVDSLCAVPATALPPANKPSQVQAPIPATVREPEAVAFAGGASFDPARVAPPATPPASNWAWLCQHWSGIAPPTSGEPLLDDLVQLSVNAAALDGPQAATRLPAPVRGSRGRRAPPSPAPAATQAHSLRRASLPSPAPRLVHGHHDADGFHARQAVATD